LGVLCTTPDQLALLQELRRTVRPDGRIGLLVFVAHDDVPGDQAQGNRFPTPEDLSELITQASLSVEEELRTAELPAIPDSWNERVDTVTRVLTDRYGHTDVWQLAERQSSEIGRLLAAGTLTGELLVLRHA
jgi:SAM-dependent methyltransferase